MIETTLYLLILAAAVVWAINYFYKLFKPREKGNNGDYSPSKCEGCDSSSSCEVFPNESHKAIKE